MCDLDFNLMPVFEALYEERRVGRAALRLGVTQSAVSQALGRLRHALNDQLFLRSAQGLVPTARARELAPLVRDVLARWREAARPGHFDPRLSSREFRIVVGSYVGELVLPDIIANLQKASDTVRLRVWNMSSHLGEWLEAGLTDMAIGSFEDLPKILRTQTLFRHRYVWIARRDHPVAQSLISLDEVLALPRLEMDAGEGPVNSKGIWDEGGIRRRAAVDVRSMLPPSSSQGPRAQIRFYLHQWRVAFDLVGKTDLLAFMPERLAASAAGEYGAVVLRQFPPVVSSDLSVIWHETQTNEPGKRWLRDLIVKSVGQSENAA
jgi:DNA-binding transcriptional LysR family regulator